MENTTVKSISAIIIVALIMSACKKNKNTEEPNDPNIYDKTYKIALDNNYTNFIAGSIFENIDINDDGEVDIVLTTVSKPFNLISNDTIINQIYFTSAKVSFLNTKINSVINNNFTVIKNLTKGEKFNSNSTIWQYGFSNLYNHIYINSRTLEKHENSNTTDKYLPFIFYDNDDNLHYGWLKVNLSANKQSLRVLESAYHKTPDTEIAIGQK